MFLQVFTHADSLIAERLNRLDTDLIALKDRVDTSTWMTILGIVIGGVLVWLGQFIDRWAQRRKEKWGTIEKTFIDSELMLIALRNDLRELSSQRNASAYWFYSYEQEYAAADKDVTLTRQYYKLCLDASAQAQKLKYTIGKRLARFFLLASEFKRMTKSDDNLNFIRNLITHIDLPEAPPIDVNLTIAQARTVNKTNVTTLTDRYLGEITSLEAHLEIMRQKLNK